ncbi:hypothetical protein KQX54_020805 [Cotesia glomerata]|uniref:Uncharacterized protein n=1 Tax=Cotesia glomerata TaxID=32391 RepID=A0AAV7I3J6_COTGL|nr:hypothetical protein KQX54_020805 [Cotesia glomerata]
MLDNEISTKLKNFQSLSDTSRLKEGREARDRRVAPTGPMGPFVAILSPRSSPHSQLFILPSGLCNAEPFPPEGEGEGCLITFRRKPANSLDFARKIIAPQMKSQSRLLYRSAHIYIIHSSSFSANLRVSLALTVLMAVLVISSVISPLVVPLVADFSVLSP